MAVTVGLLGGLGYVGIDAVLVPTPPRRFGGGVREPVEIPRKLAEGVRGERNIVLQRVDMQLHSLGRSGVLIARQSGNAAPRCAPAWIDVLHASDT